MRRSCCEEIEEERDEEGVEKQKDTPGKSTRVSSEEVLSPDVIEKIKLAINNATNAEEVTRLEEALEAGVLPDGMTAPIEDDGYMTQPGK